MYDTYSTLYLNGWCCTPCSIQDCDSLLFHVGIAKHGWLLTHCRCLVKTVVWVYSNSCSHEK